MKTSFCIVMVMALVLAISIYYSSQPFRADLITASGSASRVILPFKSKDAGKPGVYTYKLTIYNSALLSGKFHVIVDDCFRSIELNGRNIMLDIALEKICDSNNGFDINLKKQLHSGANVLKLETENRSGHFGLQFYDTTFYAKYYFMILVFLFMILFKPKPFTFTIFGNFKHLLRSEGNRLYAVFLYILVITVVLFLGPILKNSSLHRWLIIWTILGSALIPSLHLIYTNCLFAKYSCCIFILSFILCSAFLVCRFYDEYSYDVEGHIQYIQYMLDTGHSPVASGGWMFYHPSFYYRCAALFWSLVNLNAHFNYEEFLKMMQAFTLFIFIFYSYFSVRTVDLVFRTLRKNVDKNTLRGSYHLVISLFLFWPVNTIFSGRIGNDILFELFYAIAFYFILKWWHSQKLGDFLIILICASFAIWSKTNGFILLGLVGTLLTIRCFTKQDIKLFKMRYISKAYLFAIFLVFIGYLTLSDKIARFRYDPDAPLVVSNANGLGNDLRVENNLRTFLTFDAVKFVKVPYTSAINPERGRDNFWHFLFKTSLLGEFSETSPVLKAIASALSLFFLLLLPIFLTGLFVTIKHYKNDLPVLMSLLLLVGSMVIFRIAYPFSSSNDFRYIYPAVLLFCLLLGRGKIHLSRIRFVNYSAIGIISIFIGLATIYQILNSLKY
ncbi:hypothetical protein [Pedobacter endophyticus]|uniref:Dolichyl-phosphate-mannose-protein mannosyltransferase n=1 Tax=Pedobacter endophyticus TaxID=2789740 RepID=A0A7U3SQ48_9SPHI|nr:hypothetical protein [Pedobacter endophyticus]QPH38721.1 hypothetical protein IZT61_16840 [Pedobacter endophyticus]